VNKGEITICFHLSFEISPNARDSNIPTTTAASILTPFARKKDWGTSSTVNHEPGPKCQPCARSVQNISPAREGWDIYSATSSERRRRGTRNVGSAAPPALHNLGEPSPSPSRAGMSILRSRAP